MHHKHQERLRGVQDQCRVSAGYLEGLPVDLETKAGSTPPLRKFTSRSPPAATFCGLGFMSANPRKSDSRFWVHEPSTKVPKTSEICKSAFRHLIYVLNQAGSPGGPTATASALGDP